jgi:hypothetical protein
MMKIERHIQTLFVCLLLICGAQTARAQEREVEKPQPRYRMELVWIADKEGDTPEYVFVVGQVGFHTVKGLKDFVARLPAGAILEWSPGCIRMGGEPLLSSPDEMEDFKRFCAEHGIEFILHPSG